MNDTHDLEEGTCIVRGVLEGDKEGLKSLHEVSFPLRYNDRFYDGVIAGEYRNTPVISLVAIKESSIAAALISQIYPLTEEKEGLPAFHEDSINKGYTAGCYVLTLATDARFKRSGLATLLLKRAIEIAQTKPECGVIYLHVITYNEAAIRFYEKLGFLRVKTMNDFYQIQGQYYDAYLYVKMFGDAKMKDDTVKSFWQSFVDTVKWIFSGF